ncbi:MAG TPA: 2-oxoacid:ferredoxin oxidoreductase subunit beta [Candidatus Korarchaeota archaeon]|nr:2-oxoacid:ferredoxin oxidoreductase subunit beta [Candidatus Korarchaeota archaeon]HDI73866.1 2-oxoacid:ferredoxin oxidoreductase subunit beta [Candidatus Korarchaeota archaeon]
MIPEAEFEHILAKKYMRTEIMPHAFCPGCGLGLLEKMILMAFEELGQEEWDRTVFVSGIGCSGWVPLYFRRDVAHTLHGRALAFATALKVSRPELNVVVVMGDGDSMGIGGNHLIHAARRNIGITAIIATNMLYSLTGGQMAPTTPEGARTQTTPYGNIEPNFDLMELLKGAGATYLARWTTYHFVQAKNSIKKAIKHKGFAAVEIVSQCPTYAGRYILNRPDPRDMLQWFKENSIPLGVAKTKTPEELKGKIIVGEFLHRTDRKEYTERLKELEERAKR